MVAHHTINGCNLQPGDLIGTGTISGPSPAELSSMLEFTTAGAKPVVLPNGEQRGFLQDGDEITFRGRCSRQGYVVDRLWIMRRAGSRPPTSAIRAKERRLIASAGAEDGLPWPRLIYAHLALARARSG